MKLNRRGRWGWTAVALAGTFLLAGCDPIDLGPQIRFSPSSLNLRVGESRTFNGIIITGTNSGTWFVQPNSIQIATIEVTGPLEATLSCNQAGGGAFVLSTLTSQGMASGNLYFICSN